MIKSTSLKKPGGDAEHTLPLWMVASVLGAVLLLVGLTGWHLLGAASHPAGPDLAVHPGMYNLHQELQKGMAAKSNGPEAGEKRSAP